MEEFIISEESFFKVKFKIVLRKFFRIITFPIRFIYQKIICLVASIIAGIFYNSYVNLFPKRDKINKTTIITMIVVNIIIFIYVTVIYIVNNESYFIYMFSIPISLVVYWILVLLLKIYHFYIGEYQLLEDQYLATKEYIIKYIYRILKVHGVTGAGKDSFTSGYAAITVDDYQNKTLMDIEEIKQICYIFDFERLDAEILRNYEKFLTFSREKIEERFLGTPEEPGIAIKNNLFIKKYFIKSRIITPQFLIDDYISFKLDPICHVTNYAKGIGVNRKHFLQLIMEEYIQWFIRIHIEKNFMLTNQPYLEDPTTGRTAKEFSLNMLRTKHEEIKVKDPNTGKKVEVKENVFFPWKDRLILTETECGTWYMNLDKDGTSSLSRAGIRDFKAYNRHFMKDFRWIQIDQASDRTAKIFRELDHGYAGIISREEVIGGKKINTILNIKLKIVEFFIKIIEYMNNRLVIKKARKYQLLEDLNNLYIASSKDKYIRKLEKLDKKYKPKAIPNIYYKLKRNASEIKSAIKDNEKNGYIRQVVCISKSGTLPSEQQKVYRLKDINKMESKPLTFVAMFVFRTSECERYDTKYMRSLAENLAQKTVIEFDDVPPWPKDFKMSPKEVEWMSYSAAQEMFGVSKERIEKLRFGDGYMDHIKKN